MAGPMVSLAWPPCCGDVSPATALRCPWPEPKTRLREASRCGILLVGGLLTVERWSISRCSVDRPDLRSHVETAIVAQMICDGANSRDRTEALLSLENLSCRGEGALASVLENRGYPGSASISSLPSYR